MLTSILRNWGGSVALPIPKKILALAKMQAGGEVEITVEAGKIVISPVRRHSFAELLAEHRKLKIPPDNAWLDSPPVPGELL
ncbi:MAG: AbrB/MazE/SpoVT family DNA-binding domain-containing protein [Betaproteobacteria bacterium]|nr:AbrB/MazE/SpoVT family DNA-binding domain-containing protein [Betaproteobacteria bacterium]